jgi:enoyl-CoA hydratase/carnithine racemase
VLDIARDGAVAVLTMTRPASLNALNAELVDALRDAALALPGRARAAC